MKISKQTLIGLIIAGIVLLSIGIYTFIRHRQSTGGTCNDPICRLQEVMGTDVQSTDTTLTTTTSPQQQEPEKPPVVIPSTTKPPCLRHTHKEISNRQYTKQANGAQKAEQKQIKKTTHNKKHVNKKRKINTCKCRKTKKHRGCAACHCAKKKTTKGARARNHA